MKYYTINEFSKILGVSPQTLRNWDKSNKLNLIEHIYVKAVDMSKIEILMLV
jgi:DNA-binding transcriptional regulator YiaG